MPMAHDVLHLLLPVMKREVWEQWELFADLNPCIQRLTALQNSFLLFLLLASFRQ